MHNSVVINYYFQVQPPDPMMAIQNRLAKLEEEKNHQSADVILTRIRILLNKTDATFNKDEAFDLLIELKAAAATEKHKDLPHYQAVFMAMRQKVAVPASQFRKYLAALLGDKHQEKVLDILSKVDKGLKLDGELAGRHSRQQEPRQSGSSKRSMRCFYCDAVGHLQNRCFKRKRDLDRAGHDPDEPEDRKPRRHDRRA